MRTAIVSDVSAPAEALIMMTSRRSALKILGAAALLPAVDACGRAFRMSGQPDLRYRLARVRVSPDRIIREVVGLRPYRRSGFRVEAESLGDKTLVHNYG